ncbi:MAG: hypothetical protein A2V70_06190 [Planctomycetes bacterium RBG_13_63_9]|nr:MAG: hypothetical protein A2V70_06190 [Planctomycetes bacterium RBG_13_63_9]
MLAVVPDDWEPKSPADIPETILSAERIEKNLSMCQVVAAARQFNREAMATGMVSRRWALFVFKAKGGQTT